MGIMVSQGKGDIYKTFLVQVDLGYHPLLTLVKKYFGDQYIIDTFTALNDKVFKSEGDFIKHIGSQVAG
ncbi:hypothetical protein N0U24_07845 [Peribacillus frigoritolerans]|uniref:hypothetical protein n=1 Tax=Peribacillus frigoritolerans TaxID=450367 RepID=UPI0021A9AC8D|nr:hypothetical protein [Peribacillus frigoritolerans]MCT4477074.1 hypothetical protein [Peribacillus frigoritolerans]